MLEGDVGTPALRQVPDGLEHIGFPGIAFGVRTGDRSLALARPSAGSTTGCLATPTTVRAAVAATRMRSAPKAAAERSGGAPERRTA